MRNKAALAPKGICGSGPRVGRRMEYPDKCVAPFPANTFARIAKVLADDEDRTSFMREAVEKLLAERENKP